MQDDTEYKQFITPQQEAFSYLEYPHESVPHLHFAHATGFNAYTYRQLFELLQSHLAVHAMDLRGHGQSKAAADPALFTSWDAYIQDLICFLESLPHPLFLAGHSLGTALSVTVASLRPELVKGLILVEPILPRGMKGLLLRTFQTLGMGHKIPIAQKALRRRAHFHSLAEAKSYYVGRSIFKSWQEPWIEDYLKGGTTHNSDGCLSLSCTPAWESKSFSLTKPDLWEHVKNLQCPILIICGGTNSTFEAGDIAEIKKIQPAATIVRKEASSHFIPMEEPEEVAKLMVDFCETHA